MRAQHHAIVVLLLVATAAAATFVGDKKPDQDLSDMYSSVDMKGISSAIEAAQATTPGPINFLKSISGGSGGIGSSLLQQLPNLDKFTKAGMGASGGGSDFLSQAMSLGQSLLGKAGSAVNGAVSAAAGMAKEDPSTGIKFLVDAVTGIVTTFNPKTNEEVSVDPKTKTTVFVDPKTSTTTTIDEAKKTTVVDTGSAQTMFDMAKNIITKVSKADGITTTFDLATNTTTIVTNDGEDGVVRTMVEDMGQYTITDPKKRETIVADFIKGTITITSIDPKTLKPSTIVKKISESQALIEQYGLKFPPVPVPPLSVTEVKIRLLPPAAQKAAREGVAHGKPLPVDVLSLVNTFPPSATAMPAASKAMAAAAGKAKKTEIDKVFDSVKRTAPSQVKKATGSASSALKKTTAASKMMPKTAKTAAKMAAKMAANPIEGVTLDEKKVAKYVMEEKGKKKAASVKLSTKPAVSTECAKGECCNLSLGKFAPAGTLCYSSPCAEATKCLGMSSHCPPTTNVKPDDSLCPGGLCKKGVCVKGLTAPARPANATAAEAKAPKRHDTLSKPAVVPTADGKPPRKFYEADHNIKCTSGGCCDLKTGRVKAGGSACTPSKHECYVDVGTCNGYEYKCPRKAAADNSTCSIGVCKTGVCTANPTDVVSPAQILAAKSEADNEEEDEAAARQEELDLSIRKLEAKIAEARERQEKIVAKAKETKRLSAKRLMKAAIDELYKYTKDEAELGKRSLYPYQVSATRDQAQDNAQSDFSLHDYIKTINEERRKHEAEAMKVAAANLAASNSKSTIPWQIIIAAVIAVAAIAVIVAIVNVGKSGKKTVPSDAEYEKF